MHIRQTAYRILVVDDDEMIHRVVGLMLQREGYRVDRASTAQEAIESAANRSPSLIILDLSLPDKSGLEVCQELRSWYHGPIVVLSGNGEELMVIDALDAGADDYLTKPFRPSELMARIRALFRRYQSHQNGPSVIEAGYFRVDLARRRVVREGRDIRLTRTEFDILILLAENVEHVVTSKMILDRVWGPTRGDYMQTLRVHMGHLRKKIEPDPGSPKYILTEPSVGYRLVVPQPVLHSVAS